MAVNNGMIRAVACSRRRVGGGTPRPIYNVPPASTIPHHAPSPFSTQPLAMCMPCFVSRINPQDIVLLKMLSAFPDIAAEESADGFKTPEMTRRSDVEEMKTPGAPMATRKRLRLFCEEDWEC